jgi:hypothetical protein
MRTKAPARLQGLGRLGQHGPVGVHVGAITEITAGRQRSRTGSRTASARAAGKRPRACRGIAAEMSMPIGVQPRPRTRSARYAGAAADLQAAACSPAQQAAERGIDAEPIGPGAAVPARNSCSYQSAISS